MRSLAAVIAIASSALAAEAGEEVAKKHYQQATALFATGRYDEAGEEYEAAYVAGPEPALLFDAAQAYRHGSRKDRALLLLKNYLMLYPKAPNVDVVRAQVAQLKEAMEASPAPAVPSVESKPVPSAESATNPSTLVPTTPAGAGLQSATQPAPRRILLHQKWWFWTTIGTVISGAVVVGVVLGTQSHRTWSNVSEFGPGSASGLLIR
jgi:tetratricopeptide (TPR) repeat protein